MMTGNVGICNQISIFMCVVVEKKMHLIQGCIIGKELLLTVVKGLYMTRMEGREFGFSNVCQQGFLKVVLWKKN